MQISINFKNMNASEALKSRVQEKFDKLDRMLDGPSEADVVISVEKIRQIVEVRLKNNKLQILAKDESENMYASIDAVVDKIKLQIKKNKEKIRRHLSGDKQSIKTEMMPDDLLSDGIESQETV